MSMVNVKRFIAAAEEIAAEEPGYQLGHDGHDHLCDCVGLIIGAIRRAGGQWRGIHGSNYTARSELAGSVHKITGNSDLTPGEVVFKAWDAGQGGNKLPERYHAGGSDYNGDLRDYYHIGIVESVYPLRIRHMTTPRPKMDTSIGKWAYHGKLKKISYTGGETKMETVTISGGKQEAPIKLRKSASTSSEILEKIPQGSTAELVEGGGAWNLINYNGLTGYVMSEFVHRQGGDGETVTVNRAELEKAHDILGDLLGLRG